MKVVSESIVSEMKPVKSESSTALCVVEGPCMEFGKVNRNNRIYSKKLVEDRIINNPSIQEALKSRSMLGEGGHPADRVDISYPEVALCVEKLWIPNDGSNMLWGRFAILDTPVGKILNTLVRYGTRLGISARAMADSVQRDGHEVISENSYELITFDAVPEPGFKCARLEKVESLSKPLSQMSVCELKESRQALKSFKNPVFESRIRLLDQEISSREDINDSDIKSLIESLKSEIQVLKTAKATSDSVQSYDNSEISELIKEAHSLISIIKNETSSSEKELKDLRSKNEALLDEIDRLDTIVYSTYNSESASEFNSKLESLVNRVNKLSKNLCNESRTSKKSVLCECRDYKSAKYQSLDTRVQKFENDNRLNINISKDLKYNNSSESQLERMCLNYRRI